MTMTTTLGHQHSTLKGGTRRNFIDIENSIFHDKSVITWKTTMTSTKMAMPNEKRPRQRRRRQRDTEETDRHWGLRFRRKNRQNIDFDDDVDGDDNAGANHGDDNDEDNDNAFLFAYAFTKKVCLRVLRRLDWDREDTPLTAASLAAVRAVCKIGQEQACPESSEHKQKRYSQATTSEMYRTPYRDSARL